MTIITAENSARRFPPSGRRRRPLTREQMSHQRLVQRVRRDGTRLVGQLVYRESADDPHAKWLLEPVGAGSVIWHPVSWDSVAAGEWYAAPSDALTQEEQRTLVRYLRATPGQARE
jgi:hypothetical protein